eukprot:PhF_6_TR33667/c0_g1_i3/m.49284
MLNPCTSAMMMCFILVILLFIAPEFVSSQTDPESSDIPTTDVPTTDEPDPPLHNPYSAVNLQITELDTRLFPPDTEAPMHFYIANVLSDGFAIYARLKTEEWKRPANMAIPSKTSCTKIFLNSSISAALNRNVYNITGNNTNQL